MISDNQKVYINTNNEAYKEFLRIREQKKAADFRINTLELQLEELNKRVATLEEFVAKSREGT